jgi:hypothetical protein
MGANMKKIELYGFTFDSLYLLPTIRLSYEKFTSMKCFEAGFLWLCFDVGFSINMKVKPI